MTTGAPRRPRMSCPTPVSLPGARAALDGTRHAGHGSTRRHATASLLAAILAPVLAGRDATVANAAGRAAPLLSSLPPGSGRQLPEAGALEGLPGLPEFLAALRHGRPRLVLTHDRVEALRAMVGADATARTYAARLAQVGMRILDQPVTPRVALATRAAPGTRRLFDRVACLSLLHLVDGDQRWVTRAVEEMGAIAGLPDWNPAHFLDVAETTQAMAIGYDWLHAALDVDTRRLVRVAIVEKGLRAGEAAYWQQAPWVTAGDDWTATCNAAMIVGALAVADEEPDLAHAVAARAIDSLPLALAAFGSDGAWPDGPAFWDGATGALAITVAALESAIGTHLGICDSVGLLAGPAYRLHVTGATGLAFNYADSADRLEVDPALEWLGHRSRDPWVVAEARARTGGAGRPLALAWYQPLLLGATVSRATALDRLFPDANVVCMRSAWDDPAATYCAAKGGNNATKHAHLDLGTFVLDALGHRWALDLGADDFTLPEYLGRRRHAYYRTRTEAHNTLIVDGQNQDPAARAHVVAFAASASEARAVIDLGQAYATAGVTRARRGIGLVDGRRRVIVQDEVTVRPGTDVAWAMHTQAEVRLDLAAGARIAILAHGTAQLEARIIAPDSAWFAVEVVAAPAPQRRIDGVRKLTVQLPPATGDVRIAVILTPVVPDTALPTIPPMVPLDEWAIPAVPGRPDA